MAGRYVIIEGLEGRRLFSGFIPAQIDTAYGFNQITFNGGAVTGNGAGQTIALIETYNDTTINQDLTNFDNAYGLSNPGSGWSLSVVGETGGAPPSTNATGDATLETALDLEWAHAVAPAANIVVIEAASPYDSDLDAAVNYATSLKTVSVVSISYVRSEENSADPGENADFTTPANHQGITFVAASGDQGSITWPSSSPNVVGVGGTSLTLNANNTYKSETVWNNSHGASGGGLSVVEPEPAYQMGVQNTGDRTTPDVAYDADPLTGFEIYVNGGTSPRVVAGTSAGAPQWAALFAIADQGRALNELGTLDGPSQTLPMLYDLAGTPLYSQAFNDVTVGDNGTYGAGPGYDFATGLGSPQANVLVQYRAGNIAVPEPATLALALMAGTFIFKRPRRRVGE
jgi:subtilase family serine protease